MLAQRPKNIFRTESRQRAWPRLSLGSATDAKVSLLGQRVVGLVAAARAARPVLQLAPRAVELVEEAAHERRGVGVAVAHAEDGGGAHVRVDGAGEQRDARLHLRWWEWR